ncbi:hemerythrin domain-containing protein [Streptomyces sp. NPDC048606]|uniref:hemerythrin domain-containing protein n=1 Tax=Streptomyces sp. NPDC048606 TaxID=3154726 RepID=UPI00343E0204
MAHGGDVIAELTAQHRELDEMFDIIERAPAPVERQTTAARLTAGLARHATAEAEHLHPAVRDHLPDGGLVADQELAAHARIARILGDLEGLDAGRPDFDRLIVVLKAEVTAHVWAEEENLFPRLRRALGPDRLRTLGEEVRRSEAAGPHAHPVRS